MTGGPNGGVAGDRLVVPQGTFTLRRYPVRKHEPLRAWDAADELVLHHLAGTDGEPIDLAGNLLVANDGSGALTTALAAHRPQVLSDSYLSHRATVENLRANGIEADAVELLGPFDPPAARLDVVVVKVPKSLALLEDQLRRLAPRLHADSVVIGAAMAKHVHSSTIDLFERAIGRTRTTLARKKGRLLLATPDPRLEAGPSEWPVQFTIEPDGITVVSHAGVFAADHLDIGTRFLLDHLPSVGPGAEVVDLGCGNGILGLAIAQDEPTAHVTFVDESFAAVASAAATVDANLGDSARVRTRCVVGNGLFDLRDGPPIERGSIDLVVNNPPFHQDNALGDATAWDMFRTAREALRPGGELWVVGNRHLAYHAKLTRQFGTCEVMASNAKFVVYRATKAG